MKKRRYHIAISLLIVLLLFVVFLRLRFGGGVEYPDISTQPLYDRSQLEIVYAHQDPIGNVAVSKDTLETRVFFTVHPESRPKTNKLFEIKSGEATPYPNTAKQSMFNTVLGVFTDNQNRLWTIDHGFHGLGEVKVIAFDLKTNTVVHEYIFPNTVAKKGSFFNDISVSPDGNYLVVSNVSFIGKKPSLVVYNINSRESKNLLEGHPSVSDAGYVPVTPQKKMRFFGCLVDLKVGIDGIDFSRDGRYVYYSPMSHGTLFRIPTAILTDFSKSEAEISAAVEEVGRKPLSDGIRTDYNNNVYLTDVEHSGIYVVTPNGTGYTLIKDDRIRWADGLSLSGDGTFYLADSAIPDQMLQSKSHMKARAPYYIYRFRVLPN